VIPLRWGPSAEADRAIVIRQVNREIVSSFIFFRRLLV
jgi:hypothetical protein